MSSLGEFRSIFHQIRLASNDPYGIPMAEFHRAFGEMTAGSWSEEEILTGLDQMQDANQIMMAEDTIFLV
jgi:hypothetical protein